MENAQRKSGPRLSRSPGLTAYRADWQRGGDGFQGFSCDRDADYFECFGLFGVRPGSYVVASPIKAR